MMQIASRQAAGPGTIRGRDRWGFLSIVVVFGVLMAAGCAEVDPRSEEAPVPLEQMEAEPPQGAEVESAEEVEAESALSPLENGEGLAGDGQISSTQGDDDVSGQLRPAFQRPEHIRGIYLNAWLSGSRARTDELIEMARRTEINTFVIDVKDATGYVSYSTQVELAREIGADREIRIRDLPGLLTRLEAEGIYPIARIVVLKDHLLAEARSDMAIQDSTGGTWVDGRGDVWVNPYDERVWAYHVELAREAVEMGFPEIQWDYIRFPDRPVSELAAAVFPGAEGRTRSQAIRGFLTWTGEELADLEVPLTADVFGVATSIRRDVGIGQVWEDFIDVVDAALPMVYPSHYWEGSFGFQEPNAHPYEIVREALEWGLRRSREVEGAGTIIPWLQDFTLGSPRYGIPEVRAQILAAYDVGIQDWILWNASGRYTEGAFEPAGGWPDGVEPPIRLGGRVVPAESRWEESEVAEVHDDSVAEGDSASRGIRDESLGLREGDGQDGADQGHDSQEDQDHLHPH
jgi:hypothetical protein